MTSSPPVKPYGSADDLPSVKELDRQLAGLKLLRFLLSNEQRKQLRDLKDERRHITQVVDRFYDLLGEQNWIFTDDLKLSAIEHVIGANEEMGAEARLIDYYKTADHLIFPIQRLRRLDAMRPRIGLLEKALADYEAGRYYSTVLVLLSVMDGFVNDIDKAVRQGLHARAPEEMVAWDSVAGHHLGLSHAHRSFIKGCYKTDTNEVTDLFRNGIMHGTLVNFDNEIVATKAWNRLFAVSDWAEAQEQQSKPVEPTPSLRETLNQFRNIQEQKAKIKDWLPYQYEPKPGVEDLSDVASTCTDFLERWQRGQWGPVGAHFMTADSPRPSERKLAGEARILYQPYGLSSWKILCVRHVAAALACTDVELKVNGNTHRTELRWVRVDEAGNTTMEWERGRWLLSLYSPIHFLKLKATTADPRLIDEPNPDSGA